MPHPDLEELRRTVEAALAVGDPAAAVGALRASARAVAGEHGPEFRELVDRLPRSAWETDAVLASAVAASYRAAEGPRGSAAIAYLHAAEAALAEAGPERDPERVAVWLARSAAHRGLGRIGIAIDDLDRARQLDRPGGILSIPARVELGARVGLERGMCELQEGRFASARRYLEFALGLAEGNLTHAERVEALGGLAVIGYVASGPDAASEHVARARELAVGTPLLASAYAAPALVAEAFLAIERGDEATAARVLAELEPAARSTEWEPLLHVARGSLHLVAGRPVDVLDEVQAARRRFATWSGRSVGFDMCELLRAAVLTALDRGDEAWAVLADVEPYENHLLCPSRLAARLRLLHGDLRGASDALAECEALGDDHAPRALLEVRLLRAAIDLQSGDLRRSDLMADRVLTALARSGNRSPLYAVPAGMLGHLAARATERDPSPEVRRLLDEILAATDGHDGLVEPLSARELLVLAEVEKGLTVSGIAASLYISSNTVKTHLRRLYRKLGVTTRAEAIRKAQSLGLGRRITRDSPVPRNADMGDG